MSILVVSLATETTAQTAETRVVIAEIDSRRFPQVTVSAAVTDSDGPVTGLTADDVRLLEDGNEVDPATVTVETSRLENLRIVLAVDVTMPNDDLDQVKAAAKRLIDTFGAKDKLALLSFGDEVTLVREATNNTTELATAVDGLTAGGSLTALNEALVEAAFQAEQTEAGRKAIVVITDRLDNTETAISFSEGVRQAEAAQIPVYLLGFGPKVPVSENLIELVTATGGQYLTLPNAAQLPDTMQAVEQVIRQGYDITFQSALEADEAEHEVILTVDDQAQAEGRFIATPGAIDINLSGVSNGETVSGLVNLTATVVAPAEVTAVEYRLDGQPLTRIDQPPYAFEWDSRTAGGGAHTLTVAAFDAAGNSGQTTVEIEVEVPLGISVFSPRTEVQIGDEVPISVSLEATAPLAKMDLLVDGELFDSQTTPPYAFDLDSSQYSPGMHEITLRVEDIQGEVAEDTVTLEFLPAPPPPPTWFQRFLSNPWVRLIGVLMTAVVAIVATLLLALMLLRMINRWLHNRSRQTMRLEILNVGNIESRYQLQAKEPTGGLKFQFALNGQNLPQTTVAQTVGSGQNGYVTPARPPTQPVQPVSQPTSPPVETPAEPPAASASPSGARQAFGKAQEKQAQAQGCVYAIAEILDTLATFLPGSLGSPLRNAANRLYGGQMALDRAVDTPAQMARTAGHIRGQVSSVGPSGGRFNRSTADHSSPAAAATASRPVSRPQPATAPLPGQAHQPAVTGRPQAASRNEYLSNPVSWSETPYIEPKNRLLVDLLLMPVNPFPKQSYHFTVVSEPMGETGTPPLNEPGMADIPGTPWFLRYVPQALVLLMSLLLLGSVVWLAVWRLNVMNVWGALLG